MSKISNIERIRNENIHRNKDLLKQLNLDTITKSIADESKPKKAKPRKPATKVVKPDPQPTRRSRRLANTPELAEEENKRYEEAEKERERQEQIRELRLTKLLGDFTLLDLLTDRKLGHLKHELRVLKLNNKELKTVKEENEEDQEIEEADDEAILNVLQGLGQKFSAGDFYDVIRKREKTSSKELKDKRTEFDNLLISTKSDPSKIKLTYQRTTAMHFHPSTLDRLVSGGDTNGNLGLWSVDTTSEDNEPSITILKPHGRSISKILDMPSNAAQLVTCSYDGSARLLDIQKQQSSEVMSLTDSSGNILGISDCNTLIKSPNLLFMTTLDGEFYQHDLRERSKSLKQSKLLRLHDKKIGGFCVNPNEDYQIATASLDRTLRVWDLRNVSKTNSWSQMEDERSSPHLYGNYSSRLSVSIVDWNTSNHLVCNGYDDRVNIFDFSGDRKPFTNISSWSDTYRPSSDTKESDELPDNLTPFTSIKHNCQSGRWVSILKARWQKRPADNFQKFAIANMNRSIDIYSEAGDIISSLQDADVMSAVPAVVSLHPSQNWVVGGTSSGKVYLFD